MSRRFGFRQTCIVIGVLQILLAASILVRGPVAAMSPFGVPAAVVSSAHYQDAIVWVYVHMMVLGVLIASAGLTVTAPDKQLLLSRVLCVAHVLYVFMDARTSDSALGNALYRGPASNMPTVIGVVFCLLFARLSFGERAERPR